MIVKEIGLKYQNYAIKMRRKFHQNPEVGLQEYKTCNMICEELKDIGLKPKVIFGTGVMVDIGDRIRSNKTVCLRADIDALEIQEENNISYKSCNEGFMHACGHDAHIAMNLTAAKILFDMREQLNGSVRLIFQPAEEFSKGAKGMIEAGALNGVDTVYGTHVWSELEAGKISIEAGPRMASADFFTILVKGKSTHGSAPHLGIDPILASSAIIQNAQAIVSREINSTDAAVISFCQIHGGNTDNAIPDTVTIGGTTRAFDKDLSNKLPEILERVARETAKAYRADIEMDYRKGCSPLVNNCICSKRAEKAIIKNFGKESLATYQPIMAGEDFSEYQNLVPGVFAFLGIRNEKMGAVYPLHSNCFTIDESVLINGSIAAVQYAIDFLEE